MFLMTKILSSLELYARTFYFSDVVVSAKFKQDMHDEHYTVTSNKVLLMSLRKVKTTSCCNHGGQRQYPLTQLSLLQ